MKIYGKPKTKRTCGGRLTGIPKEWIKKDCLIILLKEGEVKGIYGKIRALKLVDKILKGRGMNSLTP